MAKIYNTPQNGLSPFHTILIFTIIGTECIIGIIANGFIVAIHVVERIQNKAFSTRGRILFFLSASRIALQSFMMLEITFSSTTPQFYNKEIVYNAFKVSFMFLNYCSLWFAVWLSFFYFVKIADFTHPLFLKLKWKISLLMPWLLWLSMVISLGFSALFFNDVYNVYCNDCFSTHWFNSTKKSYLTETNVDILVLLYSLGIFIPLTMFILAAILMIISLKRHTLHMESKATGSRDPSMEAHMGAIKATSYFLILYIFNTFALFLHLSNTFESNSSWNILCKIIMAAYPAGHSVLLIVSNPGLRRAWKKFQHQVHMFLKK
ncbi:taste receptor type 2 member 39-like [Suncus etruscus]|uniref:taste receptor type 2 member 39-like n=1 Tax=Suncus etruscus TaxID=109475 RepID=UPI0021108222|nr:taste receptor type 2 member 39-like [Suncus etruscus]